VLSEELGRRTGHEKLFRLSEAMERTVKAEKGRLSKGKSSRSKRKAIQTKG